MPGWRPILLADQLELARPARRRASSRRRASTRTCRACADRASPRRGRCRCRSGAGRCRTRGATVCRLSTRALDARAATSTQLSLSVVAQAARGTAVDRLIERAAVPPAVDVGLAEAERAVAQHARPEALVVDLMSHGDRRRADAGVREQLAAQLASRGAHRDCDSTFLPVSATLACTSVLRTRQTIDHARRGEPRTARTSTRSRARPRGGASLPRGLAAAGRARRAQPARRPRRTRCDAPVVGEHRVRAQPLRDSSRAPSRIASAASRPDSAAGRMPSAVSGCARPSESPTR